MVRAQARYGRYMLDSEGDGDARMRQAIARKLLGDIADDYRRVRELSPNTPVAWYNLGNILFESEDFDGATAAYTKAVELKPDFGEAYYNRGYIALRSGRRTEGIADLSKRGGRHIRQILPYGFLWRRRGREGQHPRWYF